MLRIAVPAEVVAGERRVALVPKQVAALKRAGAEVLVGVGAGEGAGVGDAAYTAAGAREVTTPKRLFAEADLVLKIQPPAELVGGVHEIDLMNPGTVLVGLFNAPANGPLLQRMAQRGLTALTLDALPRTTRAQEMDVLSSMSTIAGYHAVLEAAVRLPRFFPLLMTAAGTVAPASVLVLGAGVAGLQAIATARRLGAVVAAFDVRAAVREQVESLGARFVDVGPAPDAEAAGGYAAALSAPEEARVRAALAPHVADADVVVTTALVPGRDAPLLITREMVEAMRAGSVIIDLAAEAGGNCAVTVPGEDVVVGGVTVRGPLNVSSAMAADASQLYSQNITRFALNLLHDGRLRIDLDDDIVSATCVVHAGEVRGAAPAAAAPTGGEGS